MADKPRTVGNYTILETLGKGGYSWVKKGLDANSKRHVALKFMARANDSWAHEQAEQVRTEIKSLTQIRHENVMKLYAYNLNAQYPEKNGKTIQTILLVLEFCPGGELFDILFYTDKLDPKTARTYFRMMIQGLKACHDKGICHRDIKPQNLLLDRDYKLKLTDFGLSKIHDRDVDPSQATMETTYVGTRGYQAPELLSGKKYGNSCDVFSAGVVLFILLTGYPPFDQGDKKDKWYRPLAKGKHSQFWAQHDGCGVEDSCRSLIEGMLAYRPASRMTLDEIMEHEWYNGEVFTPEELKQTLRQRHQECMAKRQADSAKQKDLGVSVKKRDLPDEHAPLKKVIPPLGTRPIINAIDIVGNPMESIWRVKELLEEIYKAKVNWSENDPMDLVAILNDGGTINRPQVEDTEDEKDADEKKDAREEMNQYTILVHARVDDEGKPFIEFKRGMVRGAHAMLQYKRIMAELMIKVCADPVFDEALVEKPNKAGGLMGMVAGICSPAEMTA